MVAVVDKDRLERLGPAERIINTLTTFTDHMVHNRPGIVEKSTSKVGVDWTPASYKVEGEEGEKVVYKLIEVKTGSKTQKTRVKVGVLGPDGEVRSGGRVIGTYRAPGLFPEVAVWMYRQIADIWKADNEFSAHFASWSFGQDHRDMKVVLAAFMLVQDRSGDPVRDGDGKVEFYDDDYRDVGEAMVLLRGKNDLNAKLLLRIGDLLSLPGVAEINRELGFGKSARTAFMGRYPKAVEKWLRNREANPAMLTGLVRAGFRTSVIALAQRVGYKPTSTNFFKVLRWKQAQAKDGRRTMAIGDEVTKAESWVGLTERQICERITKTKPSWKKVTGMIPPAQDDAKAAKGEYRGGLTAAIMASVMESSGLSDMDLMILTTTLEDLGLLNIPKLQKQWADATGRITNSARALNVAKRVKKAETVAVMQQAVETATAKVMEEVTRGMRVYVIVDKSGSMTVALDAAKGYLTKFLGGFPLDRTHVSVFNTHGSEIVLKGKSEEAVTQAFKGHKADGGTIHSTGVEVLLRNHKPDPDEDVLMIFVGDEGEYPNDRLRQVLETYQVHPVAFGLLKVPGEDRDYVRSNAMDLGIPCLMIDEKIFADPYAITRTLRNLIASTPVGLTKTAAYKKAPPRISLIQEILNAPILIKPVWA